MRIKSKKTKKQELFESIGFLIILVFVFIAVYLIFNRVGSNDEQVVKREIAQQDDGEEIKKPEPYICLDCKRRSIDGVHVKAGKENLFPVAVMIENHVDSRPQSGLAKANLVFEAEAEGGITRFMAVFADGEKVKEIGPVRSARAYYVDWAREFSPLYVHCGGSPEALVKIIKDKILDFNEFYKGSYFWRDKKRYAPHNVYTSSELLDKYLGSKDLSEGKFESWGFKDDLPLERRPASSTIEIEFRTKDFFVEWVYDKDMNDYVRYMAGKQHVDKDGEEIRAKNIAISYIKSQAYDNYGRLDMDNIGSGQAVICLDGKCEEGIWEKKTATSRMKFFDKEKEEIKFNAGTTWIEVVKPSYKVVY